MGCGIDKKSANNTKRPTKVLPTAAIHVISVQNEDEEQIAASRIVEVDSDSMQSELRDHIDLSFDTPLVRPKPAVPIERSPESLPPLQLSQLDSQSKVGELDIGTNRRSVFTNNYLTPAITEGAEGFPNQLSVSSITPYKRGSRVSVGTNSDRHDFQIKEMMEGIR